MELRKLGNTDLMVSKICLGTMTFGEQNNEKEAYEQLDYALDNGVNFIDTAEMYSVPSKPETSGSTEKIIGQWIKKSQNRDQFVLATKIVGGPMGFIQHFRNGPKFSKEQIYQGATDSLKRLQTDYIDLYQLHWPERSTNFFGKLGYEHDKNDQWEDNFHGILEAMQTLKKEGKVRHFGISNETPWGLMHFLQLSKQYDLPRCVSIQNPYSLLNRTFEVGLSEISMREKVGLLAYSPLGFGILTGKYRNGQQPKDGRLTLFPRMARYTSENSLKATELYHQLAIDNDLSLTQMALAFVNDRPFVSSNIIGATKMSQLKENIESADITLSDEVLTEINNIHVKYPHSAP